MFFWAAIAAIILFIAGCVWAFLPGYKLASPPGYDVSQKTVTPGANGERTSQPSGGSTVGKAQTEAPENTTGGKARAIESSAEPASLSSQQREDISRYLAQHDMLRTDSVDYTVSVGAAVPAQAKLQPLPAEISDILHGYAGQQYVVIGDRLVIVDNKAKRVVAIIPGVG